MKEVSVRESDVAWETVRGHPRGMDRKVLRSSSDGEPRTALLKLAPGFSMDGHSHVRLEHHYVLEGEYESGGRSYPAGSYRMIPRHQSHGPFSSAGGALILVIWVGEE